MPDRTAQAAIVFGYWSHEATLRAATGHTFSIDGPVGKTVAEVTVDVVKVDFTEDELALLGGNARQDHSVYLIHSVDAIVVQDMAKNLLIDNSVQWEILSSNGDGFDTGIRILCRRKNS